MRTLEWPALRFLALLCLLMALPIHGAAQTEGELTAKRRLFSSVGPGLKSVRRGPNGRLYLLVSPSPGISVFADDGKPVLQIGAGLAANASTKTRPAAIVFGEDCDVDAEGRIYLADRGGNMVLVFSPEGTLLQSISVPAPISVAIMPEGEIAVATLHEPHLVLVFDKSGREVREFGDPEPISEQEELNRFLNIGKLATDAQGHLYYAFSYLPEPTVRQYDKHGYAGQDLQYTAIEAFAVGQAMRREIVRQEKKGHAPVFKPVLTAVSIERETGDVWIALYNTLLHFDKDGNRRASYQIYTPGGARLEANTLLVEKNRLIIGSDPLGIYEFERTDTKTQP